VASIHRALETCLGFQEHQDFITFINHAEQHLISAGAIVVSLSV
jgi:hypothetical protein